VTTLLIRSLLIGLAAYRLARAVTLDTISEPFRNWVHAHAYNTFRPKPGETVPHVTVKSRPWSWCYGLVSCPFCASWWMAVGGYVLWAGAWSMDCAVGAVASAGLASLFVCVDKAATDG
jgi:hypothetical protein